MAIARPFPPIFIKSMVSNSFVNALCNCVIILTLHDVPINNGKGNMIAAKEKWSESQLGTMKYDQISASKR